MGIGIHKIDLEQQSPDISGYFDAVGIDYNPSGFLSDVKDLELPPDHTEDFTTPTEPKQRGDDSFENDFGDESPDGEDRLLTSSEVQDVKNRFELSKLPSETIIEIGDGLLIGGASMLAGEDVKGLPEAKKQNLARDLAKWLKDYNVEMLSPGWLFALSVLSAYAPIYWNAWELRKLKKENLEHLSEIDQLKKENEILKKKVALCG